MLLPREKISIVRQQAFVFQVPVSEVTREMRSHAKTVNFGIIYGVTAFGLSQQTSLSRSESKEIIEQYFVAYPGIRKYMDDNVAFARGARLRKNAEGSTTLFARH